MKSLIGKLLVVLVVIAVLGISAAWYVRRNGDDEEKFRAAKVERRDVIATIAATGTLEPEEVIDVGAQVAGRIVEFGKDTDGQPVDHVSKVTEGSVLAKIDDIVYAAELTQAQAQLASAKAGVVRAQADLLQLKSKLHQSERDWERAQKLGPSDALAGSSYDAYKSGFEVAQANVAVGDAAISQAQATQEQAQANLERAQRNLSYCTIKSPVTGVIIDRRVNIGQTVVASLTAPSLFLIAKDLSRMEVWIAVNEADIASVNVGQPVTFTVDARPGETFKGTVSKVRLKATMTQNVVTYTVEVTADNSSGHLVPYMTANAKFEVSRAEDVLAVPNMALRYTPTKEVIEPGVRDAAGASTALSTASSSRPTTQGSRGGEGKREMVWVRDGEFVKPIPVRTGVTDGAFTQVQGEGLSEGMEIVVSDVTTDAAPAASAGSNPFAPQFGRGRGGGGGRGR